MTSFVLSIFVVAGTLSVPSLAYNGPDANGGEILVYPVDPYYPVEMLEKNPEIPVRIVRREAAWYERKSRELHRIFEAGRMSEKTAEWDAYDRTMFVQRLEHRGARSIASEYPQFTSSQLKAAEVELRKVKSEP